MKGTDSSAVIERLADEFRKAANIRDMDDLVCAVPETEAAFVGKVVWIRDWQWKLLRKYVPALEAATKPTADTSSKAGESE